MDMDQYVNACNDNGVNLDPKALTLIIGYFLAEETHKVSHTVQECVRACARIGVDVSAKDVACVAGVLSADREVRSTGEEKKSDESDMSKEETKQFFAKAFDRVTEGILSNLRNNYELEGEALAWVKEMCHYTVPGGKMNRGLAVIDALRAIVQRPLTKKQLEDAVTLGWCIEYLQAFFLVADDVMDKSQTRRGRPCWYLLPKVKEISINDSFLLESFVFDAIRRRFEKESAARSTQLVNLFLEVTLQTEIGQLHDLTSQPMDAKADLGRFTLKRYRQIVKYKTAFYSFYLPIACGMILGGVTRSEDYSIAKSICCSMGEYFQIQDDYLDCFGDPKVIGKVGTDIQDNKCSWLVVQALARANDSQRATLEAHYGKDDADAVRRVKELYRTLKLEACYLEYEKESYASIMRLISKAKSVPHAVFTSLLDRIYKRKK